MIVIDNEDVLAGDASTDAVVDYIVSGYVGTTATLLAQSQLSDTPATTMYTSGANATVITSIILVNTHNAALTVNLFIESRRIIPEDMSLGIGYSLYTDGQRITVLDASGNVLTVLSMALGNLSDVTLTSEADHDMVYYDNATSLWKNATVATILGQLTGANLDVGAFDVRGQTITADALTATRVVFAGANGVLSDSANMTFVTDALTVSKIGAFQATGAINFGSQALTNLDINSGTMAGVTIDGDLTWSSAQTGVTLTSPTINGTIATTGLTMPAFTLGGAVAGGDQEITNMGDITFADGSTIRTGVAANDRFDIEGFITGSAYTVMMRFQGGVAAPYIINAVTFQMADNTILATGVSNDDRFFIQAVDNDTNELVTVAIVEGAAEPSLDLVKGRLTGALTLNGQVFDAGSGVCSVTTTGVAALDLAKSIQLTEMTAPGAGAANTARIYAVVGGDTLTDLAAVFQDGTVDIFAQEATDPDSPIFQFPDNTELKTIMRKPDRKTVQFVAQFPDGREFVMREIRYPTERWN